VSAHTRCVIGPWINTSWRPWKSGWLRGEKRSKPHRKPNTVLSLSSLDLLALKKPRAFAARTTVTKLA
jgi:hypothetical protein